MDFVRGSIITLISGCFYFYIINDSATSQTNKIKEELNFQVVMKLRYYQFISKIFNCKILLKQLGF